MYNQYTHNNSDNPSNSGTPNTNTSSNGLSSSRSSNQPPGMNNVNNNPLSNFSDMSNALGSIGQPPSHWTRF